MVAIRNPVNQKENKIDRRQFIKSSAAVGASLVLAPRVLTGAKSFGVSDINVALLGAGAEGQVLMNACLKIPGIRFKAVCDIWSEYSQKRVYRLLRKYGHELNKYEDYKEMLANEKDLDAVLIATPDFWHAEHATACLEAGLHVYCEKEMSNTLEGARQIVEATKKSGKLLQVGHQRRSNPRYIHCYEHILKKPKCWGVSRPLMVNGIELFSPIWVGRKNMPFLKRDWKNMVLNPWRNSGIGVGIKDWVADQWSIWDHIKLIFIVGFWMRFLHR
jgi:hypothetical protein